MITQTILDNIRVLDLTDEKGMLCSGLLAGMGAEVIRIDPPGQAPSQLQANSGKLSISLNIESAKGSGLFQQFIRKADVIIESFAPGYLDSIGLGYANLSRLNPLLIMASVTAFGQTGPYRDFKSSELVSSAMGGQMSVCGEPDRPPLKPFGPQPYSTASLFAANGILLALWQRHTSNQGQYLDISIHECAAGTLDHVLVRYFYEGTVAGRRGNLYWNSAFGVFSTRDGYILLSLFHQWETLIDLLKSEGMAEDLPDVKWMDEEERRKSLDHITGVLEKWTQKHTMNELVEIGQLMRFPWAKVASIPEVINNSQLNERGFFVEAKDSASEKKYLFPGAPVKMSESPWQVNSNLPQAGEYNQHLYHDELNLSETEIAELKSKGII